MDNTSVLIFKAITQFVSELHQEFGSKYKNIALYNRLLERTGIVHVGPINKHIDCFRVFFEKNQNAIEEQNPSSFTETKISYSDRVFIDLVQVLKHSSKDNSKIIWQHLLTIWGLIDPTSKARNLLHNIIKESKESSDSKDSSSEEDFLSNIINKVEQSVDKSKIDSNNPMSAIGNLMQSGVMTDLVNGMQKGLSDGSLNVGKLMSSVQTMIGKLGGSSKDGNNTGGGGGGGGMPDISQMMSMVGPLMSNFMSNNNDNSSLENKKNNNSADDEKKN
jgi:hypothetical protein